MARSSRRIDKEELTDLSITPHAQVDEQGQDEAAVVLDVVFLKLLSLRSGTALEQRLRRTQHACDRCLDEQC